MPKSSFKVQLCPDIQYGTFGLAIFGYMILFLAMFAFYSHRKSPAFRVRRPLMTVCISIGIALSVVPLCVSSWNLCNGGTRDLSVFCTVVSVGFLVYSLYLVLLRAWAMLFNWKVKIENILYLYICFIIIN